MCFIFRIIAAFLFFIIALNSCSKLDKSNISQKKNLTEFDIQVETYHKEFLAKLLKDEYLADYGIKVNLHSNPNPPITNLYIGDKEKKDSNERLYEKNTSLQSLMY